MDMMKIVAEPVKKLSEWVVESHPTSVEEILQKWQDLTGVNIQVENCDASRQGQITVKVSKSKNIPKTKETCHHIFTGGQKAGDQCLIKPKDGAKFCSSHKPKDDLKPVSKRPKKKVEIDLKFAGSDVENDGPLNQEQDVVAVKKPSKKSASKTAAKKPPKPVEPEYAYDTDNEPLDENIVLEDD